MNIQGISTNQYSAPVTDRDHDNDRLHPDHDGDDAGQQVQAANVQKARQTMKMEQSVQPNMGQNVNTYA